MSRREALQIFSKETLIEQILNLEEIHEEDLKVVNNNLLKTLTVVNMVVDNRLMPHQHSDYYLRLNCLSEIARQCIVDLK
jgi:hypothetical protein